MHIAGSVIYAIASMFPGCARKAEWKFGTMVYSGPILRSECTVGHKWLLSVETDLHDDGGNLISIATFRSSEIQS